MDRSNTERGVDTDPETVARNRDLVESLLDGKHRALARVITRIENREPGHRDLVSRLYGHAGSARVVGVTGSPGAGKSTLVDKLAEAYRERGDTVGIIAVDPSSPYSGGSVLGDRIRMASTVGDMDVFVRSMSTRGRLGGLSTATTDAVTALDAFGKDVIVVETVGAGQSEVDVVRTADTVAVLVQPGSGDDVQMLKAGILEIGDVFVVNKADTDGVERTVAELEEMIRGRDGTRRVANGRSNSGSVAGHHGTETPGGGSSTRRSGTADRGDGEFDGSGGREFDDSGSREFDDSGDVAGGESARDTWRPPVVETVATTGSGIEDLVEALDGHAAYLRESGDDETRALDRIGEEIRRLVRSDGNELLAAEIRRRGGIESLARRVLDGETDPYTVATSIVRPVRECIEGGLENGDEGERSPDDEPTRR
ncbi:methylmalonyl Co-A mutase-associated GTPase MeaB [Halobellus limi]|uniref:LAO/AO transport system kinase n=1 Tax=Halobellus limi TaxID=699433 RepID=A0A1H5Z3X7_9EURY|nr:methylmalonyl Co-A mutase-associated GTPase MeaB [Halobellus limi]QCC48258.1 methylmalonyl Co-A mutase-associated GTPase MeaB [Halobellus limi]SEG30066.1 LAO/AO transport system kinase [Halobellus limi]